MIFRSSAFRGWLLAFLGNPGPQYESTRHNAGFMAADTFALKHNIKFNRLKFKSLSAHSDINGQKFFAIKPQTYMNLSGEAVAAAAAFFKIPLERTLVIFDDLNIDLGKLRIKRNGSDGGHNGIKSIIRSLNSSDFPRVKIGIGLPAHPDFDIIDFVTGSVPDRDLSIIRDTAAAAADAVSDILALGIDAAMNKYN